MPKGGATAGTLATLDSHGMGRTLPGLGAHITEGMGHTRSPHCVANGPEVCKIIGSPQCMDNGPEVCNVISPNMLWFNNVGTLLLTVSHAIMSPQRMDNVSELCNARCILECSSEWIL